VLLSSHGPMILVGHTIYSSLDCVLAKGFGVVAKVALEAFAGHCMGAPNYPFHRPFIFGCSPDYLGWLDCQAPNAVPYYIGPTGPTQYHRVS